MTECRRLPNERASQNFSFECADLKYSCTVKRFDGGSSADVRVRDAASHLQHRVNIPRNSNTEAPTRRTPADEPSSSTARSTLTSPATKAFICTFSTRANLARRA